MPSPTPTRRSVAKGAAWSVPVVAIGAAAPALAGSTPTVTCPPNSLVRSDGTTGYWYVGNYNSNAQDVQIGWFVGGLKMTGSPPPGVVSWSLCPTAVTATTTNGETITATGVSCSATPLSWNVSASPTVNFTLPGLTVAENKANDYVKTFDAQYFIQYYDVNGKPVGTSQGTGCTYDTGSIAANQNSDPSASASWTPGLFAPL